ncbi:MAG: AraC family transcriptional regulator [Mucilaginibacter sp.]|uniref:AraC family transcriptional regulator n=1 Tax=Mucilaginibacter sp. TaxID=1882438 RepID=UPI003263F407
MKLYIKNMVCRRCKMAVENELNKAHLQVLHMELGEVDVEGEPTVQQMEQLSTGLNKLGFELIDDQKSKLIGQIKSQIIAMVHYPNNTQPLKLSVVLADKLKHDYGYLSNLFSTVEGTTIEKYFIAQKTERVKELLVYNQLSLSEIAYQLNYSSVAYLSNQFKQVTGITPSAFKNMQGKKRTNLEDL